MARSRGMRIEIEGLDKMLAGLRHGERVLDDIMRDLLRGPVGQELLGEVRARVSDHNRTGYTESTLGIETTPTGAVEVGVVGSKAWKRHPTSKRANARSISTWLESGTRMHLIPTHPRGATRMTVNGRVVARVSHPGTRANRIMGTSLRVVRRDAEQIIVRELDRRLGPQMYTRAA